MLTTVYDPQFERQIQQAIAEEVKDIEEIDYIEHGADNIVVIVNKSLVFRFPRNEIKARRIAFETAILQKIKGKIDAVEVPHLHRVHTGPLFIVAEYIRGEHYSPEEIKALTEEEQKLIGVKIADFIWQLNQAVSGLEIRRLRTQSAVDTIDEPWPQYFYRLFKQTRLPNSKLEPLVEEYYNLWQNYIAHEANTTAIHDDLHPSNLLFSGSQLTGIVDFGDVNAGSIESEFRWLFSLGDNVLRSAIDHYQSISGTAVDYDHVRVWALMHELSTYTDRLTRQQTTTQPFARAQQNLRSWIPNFPL
jgi:aminoglycoside 2''-phosphotransferase